MPEIKDSNSGIDPEDSKAGMSVPEDSDSADAKAVPDAVTAPAAGTLPEGAPEPIAAKKAEPAKVTKAEKKAAKVTKAEAAAAAAATKAEKGASSPGRDTAKGQRRAKRTVRRRWPVVLAGTATLALAAVAVGAGTVFPGADATSVTSPIPHMLPVGEAMANCQGPTQLLAGSSAGTDPEFSANSSSTKSTVNAVVLSGTAGSLPGAAVEALDGKSSPLFTVSQPPSEPAPTSTELNGKPKMRAVVARDKSTGASSVLRIQPLGEEIPRGAGSVVVNSDDGDLAGLSAATCQTPSNELWLSGASTSVGRTAILAISNSSKSAATVSLDLYGSNGLVQTAAGKGLVVAAGAERSVVLSGLAPDQDLLSVHLKSSGGAVSAVIQESVLRGLTPGGVDYLAPVQAPSSTLTIPGVRVQAPDAAAKISGQSGYQDATTVLAVTVPGVGDSVVEVKAYGAKGQVALPNGGVFTATAGQVNELSLAGLPEGTYSLSVAADTAVTATARIVNSTKAGEATDLAYAPSTGRLGDTHLLTLPADVTSSLVFVAPEGTSTVSVVPISADGILGAAKTMEVEVGVTTTVNAADLLGSGAVSALVSVSGAPTYGSQLLTKSGSAGIAVLPISGTSTGTQAINITTGY
ncbi:hypothetical protein MB46_02260 [Arthrobacter alpinus]|uniref:DUF5719 family protein n=1 Tax=Arthrobacter alpinus TaxID=656366 RepID=UPI0006790465|nr:DUF5719 family protein [Arthrobacter alpinus]ALV44514.1 hypothetical protein MB46_02260 [Arthrobacter alpinus]